MKNPRARIASFFAHTAGICCEHRFKTLAVVLSLFALLASQAGKLTIATSTESFFRKDDPTLVRYNEFRDQFGRDDVIVLAVRPDRLFTQKSLKKLEALHRAIEASVPHLEEVTSLVNIRSIQGRGVDCSRSIDRVRDHFAEHHGDVRVTLTGIMALFTQTVHHVMTRMARSYPIAFLVISLLMALLIGNLRIAALAMIPDLGPIALILGFMGWRGISLDFSRQSGRRRTAGKNHQEYHRPNLT